MIGIRNFYIFIFIFYLFFILFLLLLLFFLGGAVHIPIMDIVAKTFPDHNKGLEKKLSWDDHWPRLFILVASTANFVYTTLLTYICYTTININQ